MFSFGRPKTELGVVFDIGSSSVGAGLALFEKGSPSRILYTFRSAISFDEKPTPDRFFKDMLSALGMANMAILKEGMANLRLTEHKDLSVKHVAYLFSSPWSVSQTNIATIEKPEPFTFTRSMVDHVIDENEKAFEAEAQNASSLEFHDHLSVIERRVIHVALNGYQVSDPYGKKIKRADVSFVISLAPKAVLDRISEVSMSAYHPNDTKFFSFSLAAFSMIRDSFHNTDDFVFLDVGGEISEISVVKKGLMLETASFPAGFRSLVRKVAKEFGVTYAEAQSLVKVHADGNADEALKAKILPVIAEATREWSATFHALLSNLSTRLSLPQDLFANANSDLAHSFINGIENEKVSQFGIQEVPFAVTFLSPDALRDSVVFAPDIQKDLSLALIIGFVGRSGLESY
jgi:hypothetical protein